MKVSTKKGSLLISLILGWFSTGVHELSLLCTGPETKGEVDRAAALQAPKSE